MTDQTPAADIVERLNAWRETPYEGDPMIDGLLSDIPEAANEITHLRAREAELQRKLDEAVELLVCRQSTYPLNFHSPDWHTDRRDFLTSIRREG